MSYEKRAANSPTQGLDLDAKSRTDYIPGDRVFLKPNGHPGEIQLTLATVDGDTLAGQVSGYRPALPVTAEPPAYAWGSTQTCNKDEVQHHEHGA